MKTGCKCIPFFAMLHLVAGNVPVGWLRVGSHTAIMTVTGGARTMGFPVSTLKSANLFTKVAGSMGRKHRGSIDIFK